MPQNWYYLNMSNTNSEGSTSLTRTQTVAANLSYYMQKERWSGRQMALELDLNPMYVTRRMSGEVDCTVSDLDRFAAILGISIVQFFETPRDEAPARRMRLVSKPSDYKAEFVSKTRPINRTGNTGPKKRAA